MTEVVLGLRPSDYEALDALGLRVPGLREARRLQRASRIEAPTSVISTVSPGAFLEVGAFCNLSGGTINNVRFGRYCSVASGVVMGPHEHPTDWLSTSRTAYYPQVNGWDVLMAGDRLAEARSGRRPFTGSCPVTEVGHDVWIGQGAFVKAGVRLGTGCVVGARATVLRDVPPYAVVVGTPARVVRLRFPEDVVERLLATQWWRYSIYDLFAAPFDDVPRALGAMEEMIGSGAVRPYEAPVVTAEDLADPATVAHRLRERFRPPLARAS